MFKNYLKIAWRNLWKDSIFSSINVVGLTVAFGVAILLFMTAYFALSYEDIHENKDRLFKVYAIQQTPQGSDAGTSQPTPFAEALQDEVPGIANSTRVLEDPSLVIYEDRELTLDAVWVDKDFFNMFTFPIFKGKGASPLDDMSTVVLSREASEKLLGKTEPIGKIINVLINGKEQPFTVAAIAENTPKTTEMGFEIALRFENNPEYNQTKESWNAQYHQVYVQLNDNVAVDAFERGTKEFASVHYKEVISNAKRDGAIANENGTFRLIKLLPLKDMRFTSFSKGYANVSRATPYMILVVALLILFIACVNFVNMSISKTSQRLKEIGMRKTLGAKRKQLFFQFWSESLLIFATASCMGLLLSYLLLDTFKTMFRTEVTFELLTDPAIILACVGSILIITLLVGGYPAMVLSRIGTLQSLKGKLETNGNNRLRDGLMVVQFGIAILLITGTLVLQEQINFMRNKDLGFTKEQVISFPMNGKKNTYAVLTLLKQELNGQPDVISVSAADNNLGRGTDGSRSSSSIGFEYKGKVVMSNFLVVDPNFIQTLDLKMVSGRPFNSASDSLGVIINEAMAEQLGDEDPLSTRLKINGDNLSPVLGVVKNYHFQDLDKAIEPILFFMSRDLPLSYAYVKVAPENMAKSFTAVSEAWKKLEPNAEFMGSFLDENIDRTFRREKSMAAMVTAGSIIAFVLSCIGLFAMSMLIVTQRTKEIGIRKVVGASVTSITYILTKDFLKLVIFAFLIATPVAWWFTKQWLENYAYHIDLSWSFFAVGGVLAFIIAILTISTKTIKAAMQNPVKSLRDE